MDTVFLGIIGFCVFVIVMLLVLLDYTSQLQSEMLHQQQAREKVREDHNDQV